MNNHEEWMTKYGNFENIDKKSADAVTKKKNPAIDVVIIQIQETGEALQQSILYIY